MTVSVFDLYSIGIGPSSSHTVGPMRAALRFARILKDKGILEKVGRVSIDLYGSLAMTGIGHATDKALLLGLMGWTPEGVDPEAILGILSDLEKTKSLRLLGTHPVSFVQEDQLIFNKGKRLPYHSNAMRFTAFDVAGAELFSKVIYSIGGGFIIEHESIHEPGASVSGKEPPFPFDTADELLAHCRREKKMIHEIVLENEKAWHTAEEIEERIFRVWGVMKACVERGMHQTGILPGGLGVRRRAGEIYQKLILRGDPKEDPSLLFDWVSMFALAVNEENAAGSRVVTAPTNGAAGVIPAVGYYYEKFTPNPTREGIIKYFLISSAMGGLFKKGASISAAEMGCMGEVGVACAMAAGGLTAALGGSNEQIENATEIGMEHHLGMTCDPIAGLVQIPCIERNTMGSVKAINASRLALLGTGEHRVSLDQVIRAMRQTGEDMKSSYKETSEAGLAIAVPLSQPEC